MENISNKFNRTYSPNEELTFLSFTDLDREQSEMVWAWRNHPEIRRWMYNSQPIHLRDHLDYVRQLDRQSQKFYWLVYDEGQAIGVIDIVYKEEVPEWGFYLNPELLNSGMGINLMYYALEFFFVTLKLKKLCGYVKMKNINALLLHDLFEIEEEGLWEFHKPGGSEWFHKRIVYARDWFRQQLDIPMIKHRLLDRARPMKLDRIQELNDRLWIINSLNPQ
ncbi:MAG: UDP-4-amino-4,6-dideoxy-N-acetyl-beta-L-altrosamine N-acetyltransferase [Bacteroidota bacterium]